MRKEIINQLFKLCTSTSINSSELLKFDTFVEIWQLLEKLIELEKDISYCAQERTSKDFEIFIEYLKNNKCITDSFEISTYNNIENEYGLRSKKAFQKGDLIFQVSKSTILTTTDAINSPLGSLIKNDKLLSAMPNVNLALYLLYEKLNPSSKWKDYLNILPNKFHNPLYFNLNEIKMLQTSQSFNNVLMHIRNIVRQYTYIFKLLDSQSDIKLKNLKENISYYNYRWCVSIISTRQNKILDDCNNQIYALIPVLDMCNHEEGEMNTEYDVETSNANCYAMKDLAIGDEITIFYGKRSNRDFLIHNGFVCETNLHDSTYLRLGISPNDNLFKDRLSVLLKFGMANSELFEIKPTSDQPIPLNAYVYAKIFLIKTINELKKIFTSDQTVNKYFIENNLSEDKEVKQFLKTRFAILLMSYQKLNLEANENYNNNTNGLYIKRLLISEMNIIKHMNDFLKI